MGKGPGASVERQDNGRWRVRWREWVEENGERRQVQRSRTVEDEATARILQSKAISALERGDLFEPDAVRVIPQTASIDGVLAGWLQARAAHGCSQGSIRAYSYYLATILRVLRTLERTPAGEQIPGELLCRETVVKLTTQLRADGMADASVRSIVRVLVSAWVWATDDPHGYPGIREAPRDTRALLPRAPLYKAPPAPTIAECDAVLRVLAERDNGGAALPASVLGRCTGLRIRQVLEICVEDLDLERGALRVRTGKSRREKLGRTVPLAPCLIPWLREHCPGEGHVITSIRSGKAMTSAPFDPVRSGWEEATKRGLVRRETWAPESHATARPDHAFRAAFQAHLVAGRVRSDVIDYLVGHTSGVRPSHYVDDDALWEAAREAVALLPELPEELTHVG